MKEQKQQPQNVKAPEWRTSPNSLQIYGNFLHVSWTLDDVRLIFGVMKGETVTAKTYFIEEQGSVMLTWRQAKSLRDSLDRVVSAYEAKNGEIPTPELAVIEDQKTNKPQ